MHGTNPTSCIECQGNGSSQQPRIVTTSNFANPPMGAILHEIILQPSTSILVGFMCFLWFYVNQYLVPVENVAFCYENVVSKKEWWRGITSAFSHYSFIHLIFNMSSLWSYGFMEHPSILEYIKITYLLLVLSFLVQLVVYKILIEKYQMEQYKHVMAVGYSCVVFGLMTISSMTFKGTGMFGMPSYAIPWFSLFITQLIVPQASFIGHFSGIIGGYMIYFGLFAWFTTWLFLCCIFWTIIFLLYSIRVSTSLLNFISWSSQESDESASQQV